MSSVRLDKWLWAARFFKHEGLARDAIDGGKIRVEGVKAKPSKMVVPGLEIEISRGQSSMVINVLDVREDRRPAVEAQLYTKKLQNQLRSEKLSVIS